MKKARLAHLALRVADLEWYVDFLQLVFDMEITETQGDDLARPAQVWLGGFQLTRDTQIAPTKDTQPERVWHVSIDVADCDATAKKMLAYPNVRQWNDRPEQQYWLVLPDGLIIELVDR